MTHPDADGPGSPSGETNPLTRREPLGGRAGIAFASIVPFVCLALFLVFGLLGGWAWSWIFFIGIPIALLVVYGPRDRSRDRHR